MDKSQKQTSVLRTIVALITIALMSTIFQVPSAGAAEGKVRTGGDTGLAWVGGYHEPFDYDWYFDFMMNGCGGRVGAEHYAALPFQGEAQEWYVNASYHPSLDMNMDVNDANKPVYLSLIHI